MLPKVSLLGGAASSILHRTVMPEGHWTFVGSTPYAAIFNKHANSRSARRLGAYKAAVLHRRLKRQRV
jgi:hypothetical protein